MNGAEISFLVIIGVLIAFYFMIIRPGQQEQKRQQNTIRDLREGDEVETTAGFLGIVTKIDTPERGPVHITIDFGNGVEVRALTTSVARRLSTADERAGQETTQQAEEAVRQSGTRPPTKV